MILVNMLSPALTVEAPASTLPGSAPEVMYKQNSAHYLSAPVYIWENHKQLHLDPTDCVTMPQVEYTFYSPLQRNQGPVGQQGGAGKK